MPNENEGESVLPGRPSEVETLLAVDDAYDLLADPCHLLPAMRQDPTVERVGSLA
jgi:hypothetical protein